MKHQQQKTCNTPPRSPRKVLQHGFKTSPKHPASDRAYLKTGPAIPDASEGPGVKAPEESRMGWTCNKKQQLWFWRHLPQSELLLPGESNGPGQPTNQISCAGVRPYRCCGPKQQGIVLPERGAVVCEPPRIHWGLWLAAGGMHQPDLFPKVEGYLRTLQCERTLPWRPQLGGFSQCVICWQWRSASLFSSPHHGGSCPSHQGPCSSWLQCWKAGAATICFSHSGGPVILKVHAENPAWISMIFPQQQDWSKQNACHEVWIQSHDSSWFRAGIWDELQTQPDQFFLTSVYWSYSWSYPWDTNIPTSQPGTSWETLAAPSTLPREPTDHPGMEGSLTYSFSLLIESVWTSCCLLIVLSKKWYDLIWKPWDLHGYAWVLSSFHKWSAFRLINVAPKPVPHFFNAP